MTRTDRNTSGRIDDTRQLPTCLCMQQGSLYSAVILGNSNALQSWLYIIMLDTWRYMQIQIRTRTHARLHTHSFIQAISIALLQSTTTQKRSRNKHGYCAGVSRRGVISNCEWRTCPRSLLGGSSGIRIRDTSDVRRRMYQWANTPHDIQTNKQTHTDIYCRERITALSIVSQWHPVEIAIKSPILPSSRAHNIRTCCRVPNYPTLTSA